MAAPPGCTNARTLLDTLTLETGSSAAPGNHSADCQTAALLRISAREAAGLNDSAHAASEVVVDRRPPVLEAAPPPDCAEAEAGDSPAPSVLTVNTLNVRRNPASCPASPSRPEFLRKKSGEPIKPSLKRPPLIRVRSLPSNKSVHFATENLVDVRRFSYLERPDAVSRTESKRMFEWGSDSDIGVNDAVSDNDSSNEDEDEDDRSKAIMYTTEFPNFHQPNYDRVPGPNRPVIYLQSLYLSINREKLQGNVYVRNIAFTKNVWVRYTFDNWRSICEVEALFNSDTRKCDASAGYDRFTFFIEVSALPKEMLERNSLFLCLRYSVNGCQYWDNNNGHNYEVVFRKEQIYTAYRHGGDKHYREQSRLQRRSPVKRRFELPQDPNNEFLDDDYFGQAKQSPCNVASEAGAAAKSSDRVKPQKTNDLKLRYSFGSAYGSQASARKCADPKQSIERVFPPFHTASAFSTSSYEDILSKYCFYTPKAPQAGKTRPSVSSEMNVLDQYRSPGLLRVEPTPESSPFGPITDVKPPAVASAPGILPSRVVGDPAAETRMIPKAAAASSGDSRLHKLFKETLVLERPTSAPTSSSSENGMNNLIMRSTAASSAQVSSHSAPTPLAYTSNLSARNNLAQWRDNDLKPTEDKPNKSPCSSPAIVPPEMMDDFVLRSFQKAEISAE